jgi:hypothetical protein
MNLDNREIYLQEREKLYRMTTPQLEALLGELFVRRYEQYDVSIDAYYRVASHIYNVRKRQGGSLVFHLKNFLG